MPVKEEEEIITLRKHSSFVLWPFFVTLLGLIVVGLIFLRLGPSFYFSAAFFIWLIIGGGYSFYHWFLWYLTQYKVTNERIIVKEQRSFFNRVSAEIQVEDVKDITYQIAGFWATILNYGDLYLEVEDKEPLVLKSVYHPGQVQEELKELRDRIQKNSSSIEGEVVETKGRGEGAN